MRMYNSLRYHDTAVCFSVQCIVSGGIRFVSKKYVTMQFKARTLVMFCREKTFWIWTSIRDSKSQILSAVTLSAPVQLHNIIDNCKSVMRKRRVLLYDLFCFVIMINSELSHQLLFTLTEN
jgi:hypothetical protein